MKTKNVILGLIATVFAVGGAWASSMFVSYNHVTTVKNGKCRIIEPVDCGQAGGIQCLVTINGPDAGVYTVSSSTTPVCTAATTGCIMCVKTSIFLD